MKILKALFLGLALLSSQAFAATVPFTWSDTYNPNPDIYIGPTLTHTYDLTKGPLGYRPGLDTITSYSFSVNLYDDTNDSRLLPLEWAFVNMPGSIGDRLFFNVAGSESGGWSVDGYLQLANAGKFTVAISSTLGDFMFGDATLTAEGNRVPEPASLAMLGLALAALGFTRRRRIN